MGRCEMSQSHSRPTRTSGEKNDKQFLIACTSTQMDLLNELTDKLGVSRNCLIRHMMTIGFNHMNAPEIVSNEERELRNWGAEQNLAHPERWNTIQELVKRWPGA